MSSRTARGLDNVHANHWYGNEVMLMNFASLAAPEVVFLTTFGAAYDENFVKMTTFNFRCYIDMSIYSTPHVRDAPSGMLLLRRPDGPTPPIHNSTPRGPSQLHTSLTQHPANSGLALEGPPRSSHLSQVSSPRGMSLVLRMVPPPLHLLF